MTADQIHLPCGQVKLDTVGKPLPGVQIRIADNGIGGAGAAYGASLSELFIGASSANAAAFGFRNDLNFVKNNSWSSQAATGSAGAGARAQTRSSH